MQVSDRVSAQKPNIFKLLNAMELNGGKAMIDVDVGKIKLATN